MQNTSVPDSHTALPSPSNNYAGYLRIALGVLQGILLYALYASGLSKTGLATQAMLYVSALMLLLFLPIIAITSIGHLPRRNLLLWLTTLALLLCGLSVYDSWRIDLSSLLPQSGAINAACCNGHRPSPLAHTPSMPLFLLGLTGLFIAQAMMLAGSADQRRIASYRRYFEMAWKLMMQLQFALLFTGMLWLVLQTGNALFSLINLPFLGMLLQKSWFYIPVTTLAFAFGLHLSDVRPQIIEGIRKLLLTLLSWLLPIASLVVATFLASILATGLDPLWQTKHASYVLLGAAAMLILLINMVYQDGMPLAQKGHRFFAWCTRIACLLLTPLVLLAMYSLGLRINDYGWTYSRIAGAVCILVAALYAIGYAWAALQRRSNLQPIATTNIMTSIAILLIFVALLSPLADPARISIADQVQRLASGKTSIEHFDFQFLRFDRTRYGVQALMQLSDPQHNSFPAKIQEKARLTLAFKQNGEVMTFIDADPDLVKNIRVHPAGRQLPKEFVATDWHNKSALPSCMTNSAHQCDGYLIEPDATINVQQLLLFDERRRPTLFMPDPTGSWQIVGSFLITPDCQQQLKQTAERNALNWKTPLQRDIEINGVRLRLDIETSMTRCAQKELKK